MREEALRQARESLRRLQEHQRQLAAARNMDEIEQNWGPMLDYADRIYQKLGHAPVTPLEQRWWAGECENRKREPILAYAKQARGAQHHGIQPVTERGDGYVRYHDPHGNELIVPGEVPRLMPVSNRGRTYPVPDRFGPLPLHDQSVQGVGLMLEMAMRALVQGAEHVHSTGRLEA